MNQRFKYRFIECEKRWENHIYSVQQASCCEDLGQQLLLFGAHFTGWSGKMHRWFLVQSLGSFIVYYIVFGGVWAASSHVLRQWSRLG